MHPSVTSMWSDFLSQQSHASSRARNPPESWHFCDNEADANECAALVLSGRKRATATLLWWFESTGEPLPAIGDLNIVTDWSGQATCVIRTTGVQVVPFNGITELHASAEGEGDGSLEWWRTAHWACFTRELERGGQSPEADMPIVFQEFECVFPVEPG